MNIGYIIRIFKSFIPRILISSVLVYMFKVKPGLLKMAGNYPTGDDVNKARIVLEVVARIAYYSTVVYLVQRIFFLILNLLPLH